MKGGLSLKMKQDMKHEMKHKEIFPDKTFRIPDFIDIPDSVAQV
jgi:hypothetical protein